MKLAKWIVTFVAGAPQRGTGFFHSCILCQGGIAVQSNRPARSTIFHVDHTTLTLHDGVKIYYTDRLSSALSDFAPGETFDTWWRILPLSRVCPVKSHRRCPSRMLSLSRFRVRPERTDRNINDI